MYCQKLTFLGDRGDDITRFDDLESRKEQEPHSLDANKSSNLTESNEDSEFYPSSGEDDVETSLTEDNESDESDVSDERKR